MPDRDPHRRFRLLVDGAILSTFLLVVVGGVVRVSDAGLGCGPGGSGLHGWPLCRGSLVPTAQAHTLIEYTHRFLAAVVVMLLVAILWQALHRFRGERRIVYGAIAAVVLVVAQAALGALTVEHGLSTALVAAHLGTAMLLLGVLIGLGAVARGRSLRPGAGRLRAVAALASALVLATIVAGGVVAGTERHGASEGEASEGAHLACGKEFPSCNGAFLPYGDDEMVDIQLAHRTAMFLAVGAIVALALLLRRVRQGGLALAIGFALVAQVCLGAMNVWLGESGALVVMHLAVATLLWVLVVGALALTSLPGADATRRARIT